MVDKPDRDVTPMPAGLLNRTVRTFRKVWRTAGLPGAALPEAVEGTLRDSELEKLEREFRACLVARGGEIEARARAARLGTTYLALDTAGRRQFVEVLAERFSMDREDVDHAISEYHRRRDEDSEGDETALDRLRSALVAPRVRLLTRFNELSLGVKFLVDLRADILRMSARSSALAGLERDIKALLVSWFDIGFLELTRITWRTPAAILEKLIEYEAVHAIRSWDDLKHRLDDDRRCYAFFHPNMPEEPLIFVQIALVQGLAGNVH